MTSHRLDTKKLAEAVDRRRRAGTRQEISYRAIGKAIGRTPSMFTRLNDGYPPDVDALCSLLVWLGPEVQMQDLILAGGRKESPWPAARRRDYDLPAKS